MLCNSIRTSQWFGGDRILWGASVKDRISPFSLYLCRIPKIHELRFPRCRLLILVSGSPVHATAKRPQTGPIWTDLDRTASCRLCTFQIEGPQLLNQLQPVLTATGSTRRQPVRLEGIPSKYLPNEPKTVENDQYLTELLNFY